VSAIGGIDAITVDCADPVGLARFWAGVFGTEIASIDGEDARYVDLVPTPPVPIIRLQRVDEPKTVKNRVHLDVAVDDIDAATEAIERLGGRRVDQEIRTEFSYAWRVVADPEGNEFCLVRQT
jgi:predicted enzyme related to lactoylglutathione lyase